MSSLVKHMLDNNRILGLGTLYSRSFKYAAVVIAMPFDIHCDKIYK